MKTRLILFLMIYLISITNIALASKLHQADGILPAHSAEYIRTLNRNASMDADAAFYNPAGLAFMEDGTHVMVSSQAVYVKKEHNMNYYAINVEGSNNDEFVQTFHTRSPFEHTNMPDTYYAESTAFVVPDIDIVYKKDNWAGYFDFSVMQAAPAMFFPYGLSVMDWGNLAEKETAYAEHVQSPGDPNQEFNGFYRDATATREEMYVGMTFGGAFAVNENFSFSGGLRYIKATGNMRIDITDITYIDDDNNTHISEEEEWELDTDTEGHGFGLILGADYKPTDYLNFGFRYEYYAPMELEKTTNVFKAPATVEASGHLDIFKDGTEPKDMDEYASGNGVSKLKVTYPQTLSAGVSCYLLEDFRVESSLQLVFNERRDLDGAEDDYDMGYNFGIGAEWMINPSLSASMGYLYNDFGIKDDKRTDADFLLPSHSIGGGFGIKLSERAEMSIGAMYMFMMDQTADTIEVTDVSSYTEHARAKEFSETRYMMSIGITYRFDNIL